MTAPEMAYWHPKRGKAHARKASGWSWCGLVFLDWMPGIGAMPDVPVDSLDPADLCKRCWPERAK